MVCAAKSQHTIKAMVGAWLPSQIKLLNLHRQNALQANREKQETMQTTHSFDKRPNALSGFNAPKNKEGLVAWRYRHHTNTPYHVQRAKTNQPIDCKDHGNPTTHECANSPTHQLTNSKTHRPINSQTQKLVNSKTQKIISSSTHKLINSQTHQLTNSSTHKLINSSTHQLKNPSTQKLISSKTHQLKNLNCFFYFTATLYFSCHSSENLR